MVHQYRFSSWAVIWLLRAFRLALAHGHGNGKGTGVTGMSMEQQHATHNASSSAVMDLARDNATSTPPNSYFLYPEHAGLIIAHIALMTVAWFFILPIGVMLSIARSRLALVVQPFFLGIHAVATLLGTVYKYETPDLYETNAHNTLGWILTWVVLVQCVMESVKLALRVGKDATELPREPSIFSPVTTQALEQHHRAHSATSPNPHRFSGDSGHFTASEGSRSQSVSSIGAFEQQKLLVYDAGEEDDPTFPLQEKRGLWAKNKVERAATGLLGLLSRRTIGVIAIVHNLVNRTILILGFAAFVSGAVVYGGVFRGSSVFNGMAHAIKGGIFFWYGLLTLGRWMGCFAEYGWAWNVRFPVDVVSSKQARMPSAEFVESLVIFLYGSTNVFLEHLAAWGHAWSPMDLEHLSITVMFFGGGLCGMLVESTRVRDLLNSVVLASPAGHGPPQIREKLNPPKTYAHSMNPFPGLIILLLGLMMSSHHQHSVISTTIHKQWGTLFIGFALARAVTYILTYISPPTSYLPSRPPSELISSFCLISGGLIFIASNRDSVNSLEAHGIHAMFLFTVVMGFTAFLMAWTIVLLAVKGWAVTRNPPQTSTILAGSVAE